MTKRHPFSRPSLTQSLASVFDNIDVSALFDGHPCFLDELGLTGLGEMSLGLRMRYTIPWDICCRIDVDSIYVEFGEIPLSAFISAYFTLKFGEELNKHQGCLKVVGFQI